MAINKSSLIRFIHSGTALIVGRGFDVLNNDYYVKIRIEKMNPNGNEYKQIVRFNKFEDYYVFLAGDIYTQACYFQWTPDDELIKTFSIDMDKINFEPLCDRIYIDYSYDAEMDNVNEASRNLLPVVKDSISLKNQFLESYLFAASGRDLINLHEFYSEVDKLKDVVIDHDFDYYYSMLIHHRKEEALSLLMVLLNSDILLSRWTLASMLCFIYGADEVEKRIDIQNTRNLTAQSFNKHKKQVKDIVKAFKNSCNDYVYKKYLGYCKEIDKFFVANSWLAYNNIIKKLMPTDMHFKEYFDSFEEALEKVNYDLSDSNLENCKWEKLGTKFDVTKYVTNDNTVLPRNNLDIDNIRMSVHKYYDYKDKLFVVCQEWRDSKGRAIRRKQSTFEVFSEFVAFLNSD